MGKSGNLSRNLQPPVVSFVVSGYRGQGHRFPRGVLLADAAIKDNMAQLRRKKETREKKGKPRAGKVDGRRGNEVGEKAQGLWGILYADDADVASQSPGRLERMTMVIMSAFSAFGLTVSEANTDVMCLQTKYGGKVSFIIISSRGQVYKHTIEFVCLGGAITADRELSAEITRRLQRAWACFQRCKMETYDRPGVHLRLKVRMLKVQVIETLLYGCVTWSPNKLDYDRLRRVHHSMLLRCLGLAETKARRPHPIVRRRACQSSLREHRDDSVKNRLYCSRDSWHVWGRSV